jgi:hypothetical protein
MAAAMFAVYPERVSADKRLGLTYGAHQAGPALIQDKKAKPLVNGARSRAGRRPVGFG